MKGCEWESLSGLLELLIIVCTTYYYYYADYQHAKMTTTHYPLNLTIQMIEIWWLCWGDFILCAPTILSWGTEPNASLWSQKPRGETSLFTHMFSANAECQTFICCETVWEFWEDLSNWFENQTVVIAQQQASQTELNLSWHVKFGDFRWRLWPCYMKALKSQPCLS